MTTAEKIRAKLDASLRCRKELRNWPAVVARLGLAQLGWNRGVFTASSRAGVTLSAPNHPLSRWPLIEILADDTYRLRGVSWGDPAADHVVVDVGAHVGSFTCALAKQLPAAIFTCVEPMPGTLRWLRANLARNGLVSRAIVLAAAVAEADGEAVLWASNDASGDATLDADLWASWQPPGEVLLAPTAGRSATVRTMTFDSIVQAAGGEADIVKLDCEGGEYPAILDAASETWASVRHLFLEYHPLAGHNFDELHLRLGGLGLHLVWQHPTRRLGMGTAYFARRC